jgi:hypothetical protein
MRTVTKSNVLTAMLSVPLRNAPQLFSLFSEYSSRDPVEMNDYSLKRRHWVSALATATSSHDLTKLRRMRCRKSSPLHFTHNRRSGRVSSLGKWLQFARFKIHSLLFRFAKRRAITEEEDYNKIYNFLVKKFGSEFLDPSRDYSHIFSTLYASWRHADMPVHDVPF